MKLQAFAAAAISVALAAGLGVSACSTLTPEAARQADARQVEVKNKQIVLDAWHTVINGRDLAQAPRFFVEDYIQHSPSAGQGRAAMVAFLAKEMGGSEPRAPGTYKLTQFEHVIAEGDLVQLMFKRKMPDPKDPTRMVDVWWYDTYRLKDGMIVEHWDCALE